MTWLDDSPVLTDSDQRLIEQAAELGLDGGVPDEGVAISRRRAFERAQAVVDPKIVRGFRISPLGPEWSSDIDIHVSAAPDAADLRSAGWYDLSGLLSRSGRDGDGRWAIVHEGSVIGSADFDMSPMPDGLAMTLRRNAKAETLRSVLELRVLQRAGSKLPDDGSLARAAELERRLGGAELPETPANGLSAHGQTWIRSARGVVPRRPRVGPIVSISGVDGAGKSTFVAHFVGELELAGIPVTRIWARPGYDLGSIDKVASLAKRLLGKQPEPGIRAVVSDGDALPESRQGSSAVVWRNMLVAEYVAKIRRRVLFADGLVLFDRYIVDAEVTLAFAYGLEAPWVRRFLDTSLPTPDVEIFLSIDAETAFERKPEDPMGRVAIEEQIARYDDVLADRPHLVVIDATRPLPDVLAEAWQRICSL